MKTIAIAIFVLLTGITLKAQTADGKIKVNVVEMTNTVERTSEEASLQSTPEVARLYKRINTRVEKELTFSTKANRPKTV